MANISPKTPQPMPVPRPEEILESRYDQLQGWAVGLTRGDANIALDIVHDLYLYVTLAKPDFSRVENLDNYLYKCLRHIHLAHLTESSRNALQQVSVAELDSLQFALWSNPESYILERQNELRRICHYAVWRKDYIKSASFFVLRFFHGYHLQEVADITNLSLSVVGPKLSRMRSEIQHHLEEPDDQPFVGVTTEYLPWTKVSSPELFRELRATIMQARTGDCLEEAKLLMHYLGPIPKTIPCALLSHIVSCERCLSIIDRHFHRPTLRDREPMDGLASAARARSPKAGATMLLDHHELLQIALKHREDVYDHRPRLLSIAVDGKVIASHRIQAQRSVQSAQIERPEQIGCVEVFSEQNVRLSLVLLGDLPPYGPHIRTERIELSDGRWIEVKLVFDSLGLNSEVTYFDPLLPAAASENAYEDDAELAPIRIVPAPSVAVRSLEKQASPSESYSQDETDPQNTRPYESQHGRHWMAWWTRLYSKTKRMLIPNINPLFASALVLAVASFACFFAWMYKQPAMTPTALLDHAENSDAGVPGNIRQGVIYQKVRITVQKRSLERAIYRDSQGLRRPKHRQLSPEDAQMRHTLETAGVNWDEPLSAAAYRDWHDHQQIQSDQVTRTGKNLLTLTTTAAMPDSLVTQETLTVRENDFHPVERTVKLRDSGTIEIAELNYDVLPWNMANPDWFEQSAVSDGMRWLRAPRTPAFHVPLQLTDTQLDEAELEARLALNRIHVDTGRHIELMRGLDGIHVFGVVADAEQKRQIQSQLLMVSHVIPSISTIQELDNSQAANEITSIQARSDVATEPSSAERYFTEKGMDRSVALPLTQRIVDNSFAVNHESKAIGDLWRRFSENQTLTPGARMALSELLIQHKGALLAALQEEQQRLVDLKLIAGLPDLSRSAEGGTDELEAAARGNFALSVELTSPAATQSRSAQQIAPQLAESIARLRMIALRISASSTISPPASIKATAENHNN